MGRTNIGNWMVVGAGVFATACGDGEATGLIPSDEAPTVTTVALPSQLPNCNVLRRHEVFYVSSTEQFFVCEGGDMIPIDVGSGDSLIRVQDEPPGEACPAGGHVIEVGLDQDSDGVLDDAEVTDSDFACNPLTIFGGSLQLTTQEQVDRLAGVFWIAGDLTLTGNLDISPLSSLEHIDGNLTIEMNASLTTLDALANLVSLNGFLTLSEDGLTNVDGLAGLEAIPGWLLIRGNPALTNVDGLSGVTSISGKLDLISNVSLANIGGLGGLTSIAGTGALNLTDNDALTNVDGLGNLTRVAGSLDFAFNDALLDLDGLGGLAGNVGNLTVYWNNALADISGLSGITSAATLNFTGNDSLTNLAGLSQLEEVVTFFIVQTMLPNLDDLTSLAVVHELLYLSANQTLTTVSGMTALEEVGTLLIHSHPNLPQCEIDALIANVDVIGSISVFDNTDSGSCEP